MKFMSSMISDGIATTANFPNHVPIFLKSALHEIQCF